MKKKEIISLIFLMMITIYFGGTLLSYLVIEDATYGVSEILLIVVIVVMWGQFFTWSSRAELQKDELGKQIKRNSASISHNIVFWVLLVLWVVDIFFISHGKNYLLCIALCIAFLTNPILQFILMKKQIS